MKFNDIPSHESAKKRLISFVDNNRIPHAILLEGQNGIGALAIARAFAQYIHCENKQNGDSCGKCPSCSQHQSFNHIDLHFSFPILKKQSSKPSISDDYIEEWKEFISDNIYVDIDKWLEFLGNTNGQPKIYVEESTELIRKLNFTSHKARYKIVLMWLPERMRDECANKLLKLIEEPHDDTIFILVSNNSQEILPTIYSRTQRIELKRLDENVIAEYLATKYSIDNTDAISIAHISEGNMLQAIKNIQLNTRNTLFFDLFVKLMRLSYQRNVKELKIWSNEVATLGREQEIQFLTYCQRLIRENFIYNLNEKSLNYLNREEAKFSINFARFITERNVTKLIETFNNALIDISGNANSKIVLFDMSIKTILLLKE